MHGKGVFKWNDGRIYEGSYKYGRKNGFGVFTYQDGRNIKGKWINGTLEGKVEIICGNGTKRQALYKNGREILNE